MQTVNISKRISGSISMIHLPAPRWKFVLRRRGKARRNN